MIKLIVGHKGSGKTKTMIQMANDAVKTSNGNVVCVEKGIQLNYDLNYQIRLIDIDQYGISDYNAMFGFLCGLMAGNYDITHIFIDSLTKIVGGECDNETEKFLDWLNKFAEQHNIKFTITISADPDTATDTMRKFM